MAAPDPTAWRRCCSGDEVQLVEAKDGDVKSRRIRFTDEGDAVFCTTLGKFRKKPQEWPKSSFRDVLEGPRSDTFKRFSQHARSEAFSIVLDNQATIDFIAADREMQQRWVSALRGLLGRAAPPQPAAPGAPAGAAAAVPAELQSLQKASSGARVLARTASTISAPPADMAKAEVQALKRIWDEATNGQADGHLTAAEASKLLTKKGLPASPEYIERLARESKKEGLCVTVVGGRNLAPKDGKTSDPYVKGELGSQTHKTEHKNNTLEPSWNEALVFDLRGVALGETLTLSVYDHDLISRDDYMGEIAMPLQDAMQRGAHPQWLPLVCGPGKSGRVSGEICLRFELVDAAKGNGGASDRSAPATLGWDLFAHVAARLLRRPEVVRRGGVRRAGGGDGALSQEELRAFLQGVQHEAGAAAGEAAARTVAERGGDLPRGGRGLSLVGFAATLLDTRPGANGAVARSPASQAMDEPLAHYYVSSASVLFPEPVERDALLGAYREALLSGVRCLHIEVYPSSSGPVVYPSTSAQGGVRLATVLETVSECAFETSPYPLILGLDLRVTEEQSRLLGPLLRTCFGERICRNPSGSPESLRGRVLVMARPLEDPEIDLESEVGDPDVAFRGLQGDASPPGSPRYDFGKVYYHGEGEAGSASSSGVLAGAGGLFARGLAAIAPGAPGPRSGPSAADWIALRSVPFVAPGDTVSGRADGEEDRVPTAGVSRLLAAAARQGPAIARMAARQLICVRGLEGRTRGRGPASGSNALAAWAVGCQIVPINFRAASDPSIAVARAKFAANGGCGYVLKPDGLRGVGGDEALGTGQLPLRRRGAGAGSPPEAVLGMDVVGCPLDANANAPRVQPPIPERTGVAAQFNQGASFSLAQPSTAYVRFLVGDGSPTNLVAFGAIPALNLRPGVRAVPLYSALDGGPLPASTLLVEIAAQ
eukprot:tig00021318_g20147.t1